MTEKIKTTVIGAVAPEAAALLSAASIRGGEIDTSTKEGRGAHAIMQVLGGTGTRGEVAVVAQFDSDKNVVPQGFIDASTEGLGTTIQETVHGEPNPDFDLPSREESITNVSRPNFKLVHAPIDENTHSPKN